jgi:hypothetical protein
VCVRTERPYPPSSMKANSNFSFSKSSRFSSDIDRRPLILLRSLGGRAGSARQLPRLTSSLTTLELKTVA